MRINNVKDLINYRTAYIRKLNEKVYKLETTKKWSSKEAKQKIEKEAEYINGQLEKIEDILKRTTSFKTEEFAEFMKIFLCLTKGKYTMGTYTIEGEFKQERTFTDILRGKPKVKHTKTYYVVCDEVTEEFIRDNLYTEEEFESFLDSPASFEVTIFDADEKNVFPFNQDLTVSNKYARYPRLKTAIYELIQLKLDNPNMSDDERYEKVLENTFYRNQKHYEKELDQKHKKNF